MAGPGDIQITIAQQVLTGYQQQLHQQQPIVVGEHLASVDKTRSQEQETTIQALEKESPGIKIEEKQKREKRGLKRGRKKQKEQKEKEKVCDGIRGNILDVTG